MIEHTWQKFIEYLRQENPALLEQINPPASMEQQAKAKALFGPVFHEDIQQIYNLADGFAAGAYLLRNDYRILPIEEMIKRTLDLSGQIMPLDILAGEYTRINKPKILIWAVAKEENEDIKQIGISIKKGKTNIMIWYKNGGIHDYEETVSTSQTLEEWLNEVMEYYG